jgi:hypothetical protein
VDWPLSWSSRCPVSSTRRRGLGCGVRTPTDVGVSPRLIRALTVSAVLDGVHAVVLGPYALSLAAEDSPTGTYIAVELSRHVRAVGVTGLVLLVVVPVGLAAADLVGLWLTEGRPKPIAAASAGEVQKVTLRRVAADDRVGIFIRCDDATVVDFVRGADPRPEPTESATLGPRAGAEPSNAGQTNEKTGVANGVDPA